MKCLNQLLVATTIAGTSAISSGRTRQEQEHSAFLAYTASTGLDAHELIPGDILIHKNYGDTGEDLYDKITDLLDSAILARGWLYGQTENELMARSPYDLHPYIFLGNRTCPEGADAGSTDIAPVPCVAQSSRFYPIFEDGYELDNKVNGVRRKVFSSIANESMFVWRIENEEVRSRVLRYSLALTNPWAVALTAEAQDGKRGPFISYPTGNKFAAQIVTSNTLFELKVADQESFDLEVLAADGLISLGHLEENVSVSESMRIKSYANILDHLASKSKNGVTGLSCGEVVTSAIAFGLAHQQEVQSPAYSRASTDLLGQFLFRNSAICTERGADKCGRSEMFSGYGFRGAYTVENSKRVHKAALDYPAFEAPKLSLFDLCVGFFVVFLVYLEKALSTSGTIWKLIVASQAVGIVCRMTNLSRSVSKVQETIASKSLLFRQQRRRINRRRSSIAIKLM